jgi:N-methylhydantoinase A
VTLYVFLRLPIRVTAAQERARLASGNVLRGPALVFEYSASTAIPPGYTCRVDEWGNLVIERD